MKITISTQTKEEVLDITDRVQEVIKSQSKENGICNVFVAHTTCAITTSDLDPGTDQDLLDFLREMVPSLEYRHPHDPKHVGDHLLSSLIGANVTIPFESKKLILGTWQRIVLVELDGPRERKIHISII